MVTVGLLVRLVAKPGKEAEVASFLEGGLALVEQEPATIAWFAIRLGPSEFGIFDAFPDDPGRQAHLGGQVAAALMAQAPDLLAQPPAIEPVDVLAAKLPGSQPGHAVVRRCQLLGRSGRRLATRPVADQGNVSRAAILRLPAAPPAD
jgi:quinol monooxygenase YgiN